MAEQKGIKSIATEDRVFPPPEKGFEKAWIRSMEQYKAMYNRSVEDPEGFWSDIGKDFFWFKKWDKVRSYDFNGDVWIRFFEGAQTNLSVNCLDRNVDGGKGDRVALIWEPNDPKEPERRITYAELKQLVCQFANVLKSQGGPEGRPGHDLPAHDPGTPDRDAGMRQDRGHPQRGLRRIQRGVSC